MDFFICIGFCICVIIALTGYYIAHVVKQVKKESLLLWRESCTASSFNLFYIFQ